MLTDVNDIRNAYRYSRGELLFATPNGFPSPREEDILSAELALTYLADLLREVGATAEADALDAVGVDEAHRALEQVAEWLDMVTQS